MNRGRLIGRWFTMVTLISGIVTGWVLLPAVVLHTASFQSL